METIEETKGSLTGAAKYDANDPEAILARQRVQTIIDAVPPETLVESIKRSPSLRGMIPGYVSELMFEQHIPETNMSKKYSEEDAQYLLATTEIITWPLGSDWVIDLMLLAN